jgi:hypothetical protein
VARKPKKPEIHGERVTWLVKEIQRKLANSVTVVKPEHNASKNKIRNGNMVLLLMRSVGGRTYATIFAAR